MATANIDQLTEISKQISELKQQLTKLRQESPDELVEDHLLTSLNGTQVRLSELFGEKDDLLVIHNMGRGCSYCTLWADGFTGFYQHIASRCSFVLCSGDSWELAKEFSESRNWNFPMVSGHDSQFGKAMGFQSNDGDWWPGVSAFRRNSDGTIVRTSSTEFGPGDDFCSVWPFFDLLKDGANDWEPKYKY